MVAELRLTWRTLDLLVEVVEEAEVTAVVEAVVTAVEAEVTAVDTVVVAAAGTEDRLRD